MKRIKNKRKLIHAFFAFFLLPVLNLYALSMTDIFLNNQTYIGNELGHPFYLLLWGICNAVYFLFMALHCFNRYPCIPSFFHKIVIILCMCMVLSIILPYDPVSCAISSKWHVRIAMLASVGYAVVIFIFLYMSLLQGYVELRSYFFIYLFLCFICIYGFALHGAVTSFTEITYSMGMGFFLFRLLYHK